MKAKRGFEHIFHNSSQRRAAHKTHHLMIRRNKRNTLLFRQLNQTKFINKYGVPDMLTAAANLEASPYTARFVALPPIEYPLT